MMMCQYPTVNRHQNITMGSGRKRRKREEVTITFIASAAIRLSTHCEELDDGDSRNAMGNVVGKPILSNPWPLVGMKFL